MVFVDWDLLRVTERGGMGLPLPASSMEDLAGSPSNASSSTSSRMEAGLDVLLTPRPLKPMKASVASVAATSLA